MFTPGNLNRLCNNNRSSIQETRQIIYVRFDEEGAEVKAATFGIVVPGIRDIGQVHVIRFDHPFHYRIVKDGITLVRGYYKGY